MPNEEAVKNVAPQVGAGCIACLESVTCLLVAYCQLQLTACRKNHAEPVNLFSDF